VDAHITMWAKGPTQELIKGVLHRYYNEDIQHFRHETNRRNNIIRLEYKGATVTEYPMRIYRLYCADGYSNPKKKENEMN
jgi:hypothetical protein